MTTRRKTTKAEPTPEPEADTIDAPDMSDAPVAELESRRDALLREVWTAGADELYELYVTTHELEARAAAQAEADAAEADPS